MTPPEDPDLQNLPGHFLHERSALESAGIHTWKGLAALSLEQLRDLARHGSASEARLQRLRAQARLMVATGLPPEEVSLLLHAGIADGKALGQADPQRLLVQVNRLRRRLLGARAAPLPLATVRGWIQAAASGRSGN